MRQHHEITAHLEELMQEKEKLTEWYDTAYKRYREGYDRSELDEVDRHLADVNERIKTLKLVLTDNTDTP